MQFYNYLIKYKVIKALSVVKFNLYPKSLQELRAKYKPGPRTSFYADLPKSFDEILFCKKEYLIKIKKNKL
jgi:hypothetical protein